MANEQADVHLGLLANIPVFNRDVGFWHKADNPAAPEFVRFRTIADKVAFWPGDGLSANDPKRTLAVHCGNGFDAGFSPYQSTRLSRYDAVS